MEYQIGIYNNKNKQFLFVDDKILWKADKIHMKLDRMFSKSDRMFLKPDRILLIFESLLWKFVKTDNGIKKNEIKSIYIKDINYRWRN